MARYLVFWEAIPNRSPNLDTMIHETLSLQKKKMNLIYLGIVDFQPYLLSLGAALDVSSCAYHLLQFFALLPPPQKASEFHENSRTKQK